MNEFTASNQVLESKMPANEIELPTTGLQSSQANPIKCDYRIRSEPIPLPSAE